MDKNNTSNKSETIFVLSKDDAERIQEMIELIGQTFWELLAARKVDFPNSSIQKDVALIRAGVKKDSIDF